MQSSNPHITSVKSTSDTSVQSGNSESTQGSFTSFLSPMLRRKHPKWRVTFLNAAQNLRGTLKLKEEVLRFRRATSSYSKGNSPSKIRGWIKRHIPQKLAKAPNLSSDTIIDLRDIADITLIDFPVPGISGEEEEVVSNMQVSLYRHGSRVLGDQIDEKCRSLIANKTPYICLFFEVRDSHNKKSGLFTAAKELKAKIEAQRAQCAVSTNIKKSKTTLAYFDFINENFGPEHLPLLKEYHKVMVETLLKDKRLKGLEDDKHVSPMLKELYESSEDSDDPDYPQLSENSGIIDLPQFAQVMKGVPDFYQMMGWKLAYSSTQHGLSYNNLLRRVADSDVFLMIIKDMNGHIFGAFGSEKLKMQQKFFGTGETFLFTFKDSPKITLYRWSKKNDMYMFVNDEGVMFGSGPFFGLWVGSDLMRGRTNACETFNSKLLTDSSDFDISKIEVWTVAKSVY